MRVTVRVSNSQRMQIDATAGHVILQIITDGALHFHGRHPPHVGATRLTTAQAAALIDTLGTLACVAEEQAHGLGLGAAPAPVSMPPRNLYAAADDLASASPSWPHGLR